MTTKYTTLDGVVFTRSTANRKYTYMVVGFTNIAASRKAAVEGARDTYARNLDCYQKVAAGTLNYNLPSAASHFHADYGMLDANGQTTQKYADYVAECKLQEQKAKEDAQAHLDLGVDEYAAQALARFEERVNSAPNISSCGKFFLCDCGWSGSYELAAKNAAKVSKYHQRVEILEAVEVVKLPKPTVSKSTRN
jgi:hypothetical protein